ncbi:MAG: alanine--tRNA ligase [Bdellovibrio sp. CG10_big_fil_rev_8_21_14_0_10_47_8]|nr:MAG: alanine--tRNA ligase [Bdellovibrio sp. CG10_big_fil_rev_8_21_14_0_10_47_8]
MSSLKIRNQFIEYFKKHQHAVVESSSLIPENDPTLLFTNAGMNQFKNVFLGLEHRDYKRAVSSQKCVRAGGKHNDLENVGFTARHHTFFEMLGNFSFGDYFKKEAIHFAWEFLTKELDIPKEKLYVTVHLSDDEAADIWHQQEGVPRDRIFRFDQDNFWRMGDTGPCGPCSEIFYDHGPHAGKESDPFKGIAAGEDRFVEIWNLVFMQYFESAPGKMTPLPKPSVDTGSGLERVTAALQGKLNNYDTDLFWPMIVRAAEISKKTNLLAEIEKLNQEGIHSKISSEVRKQIAALRVVADHVRSSSFLIADGALPSNEGRGYVLRRILRRAIRFSQMLADGTPFLPEICEVLIQEMSGVYPELKQRKDLIMATLKDEQDRFISTLTTGTSILNQELARLKSNHQKKVPGELVFKLYDTYGFPADLTSLMAEEQGFSVDAKSFDQQVDAAREKAKASWKGKSLSTNQTHLIQLAQEINDIHGATAFTFYASDPNDRIAANAKVLVLSDGEKEVSELKAGDTGILVVNRTPFYAESGGQAGDKGIFTGNKIEGQVLDCTKLNNVFFHQVHVNSGTLTTNSEIKLIVTAKDRDNTAANHSATHLLHSALREVLGTHVSQAGQMVDAGRIRFDFTHNKAITSDELKQIEGMVNNEISGAHEVQTKIMKHQEALDEGAMALFGEKYGDTVRVLKMGSFSTELCGGTHVNNTAQIRLFKIVSESGVSAGVRRIEALSGDVAIQYALTLIDENMEARRFAGLEIAWDKILHQQAGSLPEFLEKKKSEIKNLEREIKKIQGSSFDVDQHANDAKVFISKSGPAKFAIGEVSVEDRGVLAQMADQLKNKIKNGVVVIIGRGEGTHPLIVSVTKEVSTQFQAGQILKEMAQIMGGKGGGRPDFAQGAVPLREKWPEAVAKAESLLQIAKK